MPADGEPRTPQPPKFVSPKGKIGARAARVREFLPPLYLGVMLSPKNARSPRGNGNVVSVAAKVREAASVVSVVHSPAEKRTYEPISQLHQVHQLELPPATSPVPPRQGNVGFEALEEAIHRVLENLSSHSSTRLSLDEKWLRVSQHLDNYAVEIEKRRQINEFISKLPEATPIEIDSDDDDDESTEKRFGYTPEVCIAAIDHLLNYLSSVLPNVNFIVKVLRQSISDLIFIEDPSTPLSPKEERLLFKYEGIPTYKEQAQEAIEESEGMKRRLIVSSSTARGIGPAIDYINNLITRMRCDYAAKILRMWRAGMRSRRYTGSLERRLVAREKRIHDLEAKLESSNESIKNLQKEVATAKKDCTVATANSKKYESEIEVLKERGRQSTNVQKKLKADLEISQTQLRASAMSNNSDIQSKNKEITKLHLVLNESYSLLRGATDIQPKRESVIDFLNHVNDTDSDSGMSDRIEVQSTGDELISLAATVLKWLDDVNIQASETEIKLQEQTSFYLPDKEIQAIFTALSWSFPQCAPPIVVKQFNSEINLESRIKLLLTSCEAASVSCNIEKDQLQYDGNSRMLLTCNIMNKLLTNDPDSELNPRLLTDMDAAKVKKQLSMVAKTPEDWYKVLTEIMEKNKERNNCYKELNEKIQIAFIANHFKAGDEFLTNSEVRDRRKFSIVDTSRIRDQLETFGEDVSDGIDSINRVLETHFRRLRNIYRYYSSCESSCIDNALTKQEFSQLLRDCRVFGDKGRSTSSSRRFHRATSNDRNDSTVATNEIIKELNSIGIKDKTDLNQEEYTAALVMVAGNRCRGETAAEKLNNFILHHIIPFANYVAVDEFKEELKTSQCQLVLTEVKSYLLRSYAYYSALDTGEGSRKELSWKEFKRLMDDIKVVDEVCTHYAVMQMFLKLLSDTSSTDEQLTMNYQDFVVAICAVAAFKNPAPYLPLHQKIRRFVQVWIVQCLGKRLKWDDRTL